MKTEDWRLTIEDRYLFISKPGMPGAVRIKVEDDRYVIDILLIDDQLKEKNNDQPS